MVTRLEGRGLAYRYPDGAGAVQGVDVHCEGGSLVALAGRNGAGKSTLLGLLGGLLKPDAGGVTCDGLDLHAMPVRERARRIAIVPQELRARPDVTTEEFLYGGLYAWRSRFSGRRPEDSKKVAEVLECAGLDELGSALITELSGGERQRALLARAMVQGGQALLVDEPTSSLDAHHQLRTFATLRALASEGQAVIVVTHDFNLASQFADEIALLDDGRMVCRGGPDAVLVKERLVDLYGPDLHFGRLPSPATGQTRPFVLPWMSGERRAGTEERPAAE